MSNIESINDFADLVGYPPIQAPRPISEMPLACHLPADDDMAARAEADELARERGERAACIKSGRLSPAMERGFQRIVGDRAILHPRCRQCGHETTHGACLNCDGGEAA